MYQAIDIDAIKAKVMRNFAAPAGLITSPGVHGHTKELDKRLKYDVAAAKKLMADAGYPNGFEVTLDCPNDRYINDEKICQAVAGMLAQIGIKVTAAGAFQDAALPQAAEEDSASSCWAGACRRSIRTTSSPPATRPRMPRRRWAAGTSPTTQRRSSTNRSTMLKTRVDQAKRDRR